MTKNPVINALAAALYIAGVVSTIFFGSALAPVEDSLLIPIAMLSLFCLSAAVMSFIFFYQPVTMYLEGEKQAAVKLLVQTIGSFAVITAILLATLFLQWFL